MLHGNGRERQWIGVHRRWRGPLSGGGAPELGARDEEHEGGALERADELLHV